MLRNISVALLLATLLLAVCTGDLMAQTNASATVDASATVLTALTITNNANVLFGNISATTGGVVYLNPNGASNYVGVTAHIGRLTVAGANSQGIRLTWPTSLALSDGVIPTNLNYDLAVNGFAGGNTPASSGLLTLTTGYCNVTTSGSGAYTLFIGGSLGGVAGVPAALSTQLPGIYTGTATFTVEYQ